MKPWIRVSLIFLLLLPAGCAVLAGRTAHTVPAGSSLTLEKPIDLPAGPFSVWIQDGRYGLDAVDDYRPFCKLQGDTSSKTGLTLQPDRFTVVAVHYRYGTAMGPAAFRVASLTSIDVDNSELTMLQTQMELRAERPSPLHTMVCMKRGFVGRDHFLSVADIRGALGDYFTLTLPPPPQ